MFTETKVEKSSLIEVYITHDYFKLRQLIFGIANTNYTCKISKHGYKLIHSEPTRYKLGIESLCDCCLYLYTSNYTNIYITTVQIRL